MKTNSDTKKEVVFESISPPYRILRDTDYFALSIESEDPLVIQVFREMMQRQLGFESERKNRRDRQSEGI